MLGWWAEERAVGGKSETASETVCGKCWHTREIVRLCACVLFGGTKLVFVATGILSEGSSEGSRGSGYGHLGSSYRPISSSHMRLSFLCPIPRLRISKQRHWISSPSSSAALFSSFSPSSSFSSFTSPILWHVPPADSSRSAILMARSKSKARSGYLTVNLL